MRKIFLTLASVFVCFLIEQLLARYLGRWFTPDLLLILIVFFNLSRSTRYSLLAAVFAGLLKDSFVPRSFGLYTFSFICCAYLTSLLKVYIYQTGSMGSRILIVAIMTVVNAHILFFLNLMSTTLYYGEMFRYLLVPELLATTVATPYVFGKFKSCVLRYFV